MHGSGLPVEASARLDSHALAAASRQVRYSITLLFREFCNCFRAKNRAKTEKSVTSLSRFQFERDYKEKEYKNIISYRLLETDAATGRDFATRNREHGNEESRLDDSMDFESDFEVRVKRGGERENDKCHDQLNVSID